MAKPMALEITEGFYSNNIGIFKVQKALNGQHLYAKLFNPATLNWDYYPGAMSKLQPQTRMTKEQASEFGHLYGQCIMCGRRLTDENSIEAGIGPVCAGKW